MSLKINDRIALKGKVFGTLRYIGPIKSKEGIWAGIELDDPLGKTDGKVMGERYFTCKMKHALFVKYEKLVQNIKPIDVLSIDKDISYPTYDKLPNVSGYDSSLNNELGIRDFRLDKSKNLYPSRIGSFNREESQSRFNHLSDIQISNNSLFVDDEQKQDSALAFDQALQETAKYKMLVQFLINKFSTALDSIMERLNILSNKVEKAKKYYKTETERDVVVGLVESIFKAIKNNDKDKTTTYLDKFKTIMHRYDIKVD